MIFWKDSADGVGDALFPVDGRWVPEADGTATFDSIDRDRHVRQHR